MTNGRLVVSTGLGLFYKDPAAANWIKSYPASGYQRSLAVYTDGSGAIYTLLPNPSINARTFGSVLKSTDGGSSWNPDTAGLSVTTGTLFYVDETGVQHMASTYYGGSIPSMLYAKMPGNSWAADTMGFTSNTYNFSSSFGSDKHGYLYSSGYYGGIQMYRRPISGGAWVADTAGLSGINYFYSMVADGSGGMYGYASSGIYRRAAGVWAAISLPAGLTLPSPSQISVDSSGALFASFTGFNFTTSTFGSLGVYFTTDAGVTWTHAGADEGNVLQLISFGDTTYALASGEAYILTRTAALGVNGRTAQPTAYALHQNYPNPFNPAATISYDVQAESRVTLAVYNTLGQLVARLVDGMQSAGTHTAHFDGANLPSGVYFYRLEAVNIADPAKSFIQTKKMALVK